MNNLILFLDMVEIAKNCRLKPNPWNQFLKNELRRRSKFELSWDVQLLKHFSRLAQTS
jgi:hypothetical protein